VRARVDGRGIERVALRRVAVDDGNRLDSAARQLVGDEVAVAAPGNGFGAQGDGHASIGEEPVEGFAEGRRRHGVGLRAERLVSLRCR